MSNTRERIEILRRLIAQRIVVLDGATGTSIQGMNLHAGYFGGPSLDGCNENLVVTSPDKISELHRSFLEAGADIVETNSFGSTSVVLAEYGLERQARELNRIAAQLARARSRRLQHCRASAVRRRLDGSDDQKHFGHRRRYFRSILPTPIRSRPKG